VTRLSVLFALDSLGGGFVSAALVSYFFFGAALKIAYDIALWLSFHRLPPPGGAAVRDLRPFGRVAATLTVDMPRRARSPARNDKRRAPVGSRNTSLTPAAGWHSRAPGRRRGDILAR